MKNSWQILTFLLAVALVLLSIKISVMGNSSQNVNSEQVGIDLIMTRSSVRSYTSQKVEQSKIETMLKAGMAAPTAGNRQPWEFVVVSDRETLDKFPALIPGAHMAAKAQLAIVVCGSPKMSLLPEYWVQDCSAATQNILLAAHAMGLGAVWCGAYPNNSENKVGKMQELLSLPENMYALSVIVIGYPDSEPSVKDKWKPERVHYQKY